MKMILIDARCVIFNILQMKESLTFEELHIFAKKVKSKYNCCYVDISDDAVLSTIEAYPNTLLLNNKVIYGKNMGEFKKRQFINNTFNRGFSLELKKILQECAASLQKEIKI